MTSPKKLDKSYENLPLFKGITLDELAVMLPCLGGVMKTYKKGAFIALAQEEIQYVGIVLSGSVHMIHEDIWGDKSILALIEKGGLFGETFACGTNFTSCVTFQAITDTHALVIPFRKVLHSCDHACPFHQQLIENMAIMLADKNAQLMQKLQVTSKKSLRKKIMTYLSFQAQSANSRTFKLPLSRTGLADYICADRTALARELTRMKEEGLIAIDRNTITLL